MSALTESCGLRSTTRTPPGTPGTGAWSRVHLAPTHLSMRRHTRRVVAPACWYTNLDSSCSPMTRVCSARVCGGTAPRSACPRASATANPLPPRYLGQTRFGARARRKIRSRVTPPHHATRMLAHRLPTVMPLGALQDRPAWHVGDGQTRLQESGSARSSAEVRSVRFVRGRRGRARGRLAARGSTAGAPRACEKATPGRFAAKAVFSRRARAHAPLKLAD